MSARDTLMGQAFSPCGVAGDDLGRRFACPRLGWGRAFGPVDGGADHESLADEESLAGGQAMAERRLPLQTVSTLECRATRPTSDFR